MAARHRGAGGGIRPAAALTLRGGGGGGGGATTSGPSSVRSITVGWPDPGPASAPTLLGPNKLPSLRASDGVRCIPPCLRRL